MTFARMIAFSIGVLQKEQTHRQVTLTFQLQV